LTEQTNKKKHTVKQIPRPSLYERMAGNNITKLQNIKCSALCSKAK